jgi:hypothetical protein
VGAIFTSLPIKKINLIGNFIDNFSKNILKTSIKIQSLIILGVMGNMTFGGHFQKNIAKLSTLESFTDDLKILIKYTGGNFQKMPLKNLYSWLSKDIC